MFVNDKIVFLELQKTGCSHIVKLLDEFLPGKQIGKHHLLREEDIDKKIIGSIRNPWDWYVSLWAYGCNKQGGLYKRAVNAPKLNAFIKPFGTEQYNFQNIPFYLYDFFTKPTKEWESLYEDYNKRENFKKWIRLVLSPERNRDFGGGFAFHPVSKFAGLLTYRYCRLFTASFFDPAIMRNISSLEDLEIMDLKHNRLVGVIKNESLEKDFIQLMNKIEYPLGDKQEQRILGMSKTNTSKHKHINYYYDDETLELVALKEKFIIEKYNYKNPKLQK
jgi:hypothetical protein